MKQETRQYLDLIACIAEENLAYLRDVDEERTKPRDRGATLLMSAYLELYALLAGPIPCREGPSELVQLAAETCVGMRRGMRDWPGENWREQEHGLHNLMLTFMFLIKRLFVVRH